jgi:hypothetical protein
MCNRTHAKALRTRIKEQRTPVESVSGLWSGDEDDEEADEVIHVVKAGLPREDETQSGRSDWKHE